MSRISRTQRSKHAKLHDLIERVFEVIFQNSGKIRTADLDTLFNSKHSVRFAITKNSQSWEELTEREGLGKTVWNTIIMMLHHNHSKNIERWKL